MVTAGTRVDGFRKCGNRPTAEDLTDAAWVTAGTWAADSGNTAHAVLKFYRCTLLHFYVVFLELRDFVTQLGLPLTSNFGVEYSAE